MKYARCLAVGKIFLVCFYLFVETICHLYVFIQTSKTESSHTAPSLLPLHMMVSAGGGGGDGGDGGGGGGDGGGGGGVHHSALVSSGSAKFSGSDQPGARDEGCEGET